MAPYGISLAVYSASPKRDVLYKYLFLYLDRQETDDIGL